jgi:hypothetical protein
LTSSCAARSSAATRTRSAPTQTGHPLRRESRIGSSPTSAAVEATVAARGSEMFAP